MKAQVLASLPPPPLCPRCALCQARPSGLSCLGPPVTAWRPGVGSGTWARGASTEVEKGLVMGQAGEWPAEPVGGRLPGAETPPPCAPVSPHCWDVESEGRHCWPGAGWSAGHPLPARSPARGRLLTCTPSWAKKALVSASAARCRQVVLLQQRFLRTSRAKARSSLLL